MPAILRINIVTNASGAQPGINQTHSALDRLGKIGTAAAAGVAGVSVAAIALGKEAYQAASAVQQSFGALDSVFGKSSATVKAWASDAADSVGLAKSEYANLATVLGSQLTNMGRSQAQAATETNNLIGLGADLAATFGGSVADAVEAVSSTLKGETDPIERYGISIKQSDIQARLAAQGLGDLKGAALKQASATAALDLITKQATASHGAFGREANTAAGQQERLSANVENLKAKLGAGLLPVMTTAFAFINTQAIPAAQKLGARFQRDVAPHIAATARVIREDVIPAAIKLIHWFNDKIVPSIVGTVKPAVAGLRDLFSRIGATFDKNSGSLQKLGVFLGKVATVAAKIGPIIGTELKLAFEILGTAIDVVVTTISTMISLVDHAIDGLQKLGDLAGKVASPLKAVGGALGHLNPFAAGELAGPGAPLMRPADLTGVRGLLTAAAGGGLPYGYSTTASASSSPALVDARTYVTVNVDGALDPVATARQVRELLRADEVRLGRAPAFAPTLGWS